MRPLHGDFLDNWLVWVHTCGEFSPIAVPTYSDEMKVRTQIALNPNRKIKAHFSESYSICQGLRKEEGHE
jgi:hypothetical protein